VKGDPSKQLSVRFSSQCSQLFDSSLCIQNAARWYSKHDGHVRQYGHRNRRSHDSAATRGQQGARRVLRGKGKGREGVLSDSQIAFQMYREDLERSVTLMEDRKMSSSIAQACQMDGDVLVESLSQEQAAAGDREIACRLGGVAAHHPLPPWTVGSEFLDDEILEKLRALYVTAPVEEESLDGQLVKGRSDRFADENDE
jgi:hypothetical protein